MKALPGRLYHEQKGQAVYLVCVAMVALLGMAALAIDIGYVLHAQRELQVCVDAAATAGGAAMPNGGVVDPGTIAEEYSGDSKAQYNKPKDISISSSNFIVKYDCVTGSTASNLNMPPCMTLSATPGCGLSPGCNAIQVKETATVNTFFAKVFGFTSVSLSAIASASASGGGATPYHIVLALDSTSSMGTTNDTGCLSTNLSAQYTAEQCAQLGIQTLLSELTPCPTGTSNCSVSSAVDPVALLTFPGLKPTETTTLTNPPVAAATASDDYSCPPSNPTITSYNNNPGYLILPFQTDYRVSGTSGLNFGNSNLVDAVAASNYGKCSGIQTPGGEKTFYAGVLLEAQAYLSANHASGVQDVIIFLSDGSANATTGMAGNVAQTAPIGGLTAQNTFSTTGECTQAVNAAKYDQGLGTKIYSISYNSGSSGCTSGETSPYDTPCMTMQGIASLPLSQYFFSVPNNKTHSPQCGNAIQIQYLYQVFNTIAGDLESARLIPNNAF